MYIRRALGCESRESAYKLSNNNRRSGGQAALSTQTLDLQRERDRATNALAALATEDARRKKSPNEVLKLRLVLMPKGITGFGQDRHLPADCAGETLIA